MTKTAQDKSTETTQFGSAAAAATIQPEKTAVNPSVPEEVNRASGNYDATEAAAMIGFGKGPN